MKSISTRVGWVLALAAMAFCSQAHAQKTFQRDNPKFLAAFRSAVTKPASSAVAILCDGQETALGTVVGADGWVLTKAHDLHGSLQCRLRDGRVFDARWVGFHKDNDLALLKIEANDLPAVQFADSKGTPVGNWVACAGLKDDPVAFGVVSVATRAVPDKGGPVANANPKSGYLGVALDPSPQGVRITQIMPDSAADKASLKINDIIVALEGKTVSNEPQDFIGKMTKTKPGQVITLKIKRDDEEMEIKAKLAKRPFNRGDFQNQLGSDLSSRRSGYPTILQFDGVVKPNDCGGPLVNLDGQVIGVCISRAGRTETWAIPSEAIKPLLADLKSGKLPPPKDSERIASPKGNQPKKKEPPAKSSGLNKDDLKAVDELLTLMHRRPALMPDVARWKWNAGVPIADAVREKAFLDKIQADAKELRVDSDFARRFFRRAA